jgi:hypothetical protein
MNRDNIREMLANIEEAVTENFASPPRYRNDNEGDATADPDAEDLNALVLRVAAASVEEIDRVILELQGVRAREHADTVARELTFKTTGILGEGWSKWTMVVNDGDGLELFSFGMSTVRNGTGK